MKLAVFIKANIEAISAEWERFAATLLPAENFSALLLRNDIVDILNEVATDMDREQSAEQQQEKSEGNLEGGPQTGNKLVAVPYDQLHLEADKDQTKITMPGASKDALNAMPTFTYGG